MGEATNCSVLSVLYKSNMNVTVQEASGDEGMRGGGSGRCVRQVLREVRGSDGAAWAPQDQNSKI